MSQLSASYFYLLCVKFCIVCISRNIHWFYRWISCVFLWIKFILKYHIMTHSRIFNHFYFDNFIDRVCITFAQEWDSWFRYFFDNKLFFCPYIKNMLFRARIELLIVLVLILSFLINILMICSILEWNC